MTTRRTALRPRVHFLCPLRVSARVSHRPSTATTVASVFPLNINTVRDPTLCFSYVTANCLINCPRSCPTTNTARNRTPLGLRVREEEETPTPTRAYSPPLMQVTSQSKPSNRPDPFNALVSWMDHCRFFISAKPNDSLMLRAFNAPFESCLFANTNKMASFNSSSSNMAISSCLATLRRSTSQESTTKIMASVFG